jgi:hypothetical protein
MEVKKGMLWTVLKWIGRAVFAIFILALVYFQAPIKVITFFLIFLLAGIFLKKPYYKYFWLTVLAVVIGLTVWVFLPEDDNGWKPFAFEKDIQALNAKYAVPDSENAALIYNEIFAEYTAKDLDPNLTDDAERFTFANPWTAEQYPQLAQWLKAKEPLIEKLKQAAEKEKCFFELKSGLNIDMDSLNLFRNFTYLIVRKANNDIAVGNIDAAIEELSVSFQIAKHIYQQPLLIDYLVAISIDSMTRQSITEMLVKQQPTDEQYNKITVLLEKNKFSWDDARKRAIEYENLRFKKIFLGMLYETKDGKGRFTRDPSRAIGRTCQTGYCYDSKNPPYWLKKGIKARTIFAWFIFPSNPDSLVKRIDTIFDEYSVSRKIPKGYKFKLRYENTLDVMGKVNFESYEGIRHIFNKHQDGRDGSLLVLEISKFKNKNGNWPQSLKELNTAGIPLEKFIYKPIDETNFILYSMGDNGIDDGGKWKYCGEPKTETSSDDLLVWPRTLVELVKLTGNVTPIEQFPGNPGMGMPGSVEADK